MSILKITKENIKMKKILTAIIAVVFTVALAAGFTACTKANGVVIAVPNDTTNEARALMLLEQQGFIKLKEGAGITATVRDIVENPYNIKFKEVEAAQLPNFLQDVDFAVINSNFALVAKLNPASDALAVEGAYSAYGNVVAVKQGNEETSKTKALMAALKSERVKNYISATYGGAVISVVENAGDGFDASVDYAALSGQTIKVGASPAPHAEILSVAKEILAEKNVTLEVVEYSDYVQPNLSLEDGSLDANYFQHLPYLDDFNLKNGTHLVSVGAVHVEPMGIYSKKHASLNAIKTASGSLER